MPKQQQTLLATTKEEITLEPKVRRKLLAELRRYEAVQTELKALEEQKKAIAARVQTLHQETGYNSLDIDGFKVTIVQGTYTKINEKKLLTWISVAQLEEAREIHSRKPFEKITCPKDEEE